MKLHSTFTLLFSE